MSIPTRASRIRRWLVGTGVLVVVLGSSAGLWAASLLPDTYSMTSMGYADYGGGTQPQAVAGSHSHAQDGVDLSTLVPAPDRPADVRVDLVARAERVTLAGVPPFDGFTLNGTTPGPTIRARAGELVEVHATNQNVTDGMTLHWHGVDLPNAMDGVAGVTQDAIAPGERFVYRFIAQEGTYWYHSHQVSHPQVSGGLLGALVVDAATPDPRVVDVTALVHAYAGTRTVNGKPGGFAHPARPGDTARVRVINTDSGPMPVWVSGASYRVVAVDGRALNRPGQLTGEALVVTAGGRADLEVVVPTGGARVEFAGASVSLGDSEAPHSPAPRVLVDLLSYGSPGPTIQTPGQPDRTFEYRIGRRLGLLDGRPGSWWTINGGLYPNVPMFMVRTGERVRFLVSNESGEVHPMHLHGHHLLVVARDGVRATGSPWLVDSLNVEPGETYELQMVADNPGIWMDHCHNLPHAREGLMTHVAYEGYRSTHVVGGDHGNSPE
ncbi:MAG TPA: multicopper oxidase family protein [Arachnia sp.]|nr:multicopper oxidase family protein [Arachnia sp.]